MIAGVGNTSANKLWGNVMLRRTVLKGVAATAASGLVARPAIAADTALKMGISLPMTGKPTK